MRLVIVLRRWPGWLGPRGLVVSLVDAGLGAVCGWLVATWRLPVWTVLLWVALAVALGWWAGGADARARFRRLRETRRW
jgi:hypothetical protein